MVLSSVEPGMVCGLTLARLRRSLIESPLLDGQTVETLPLVQLKVILAKVEVTW